MLCCQFDKCNNFPKFKITQSTEPSFLPQIVHKSHAVKKKKKGNRYFLDMMIKRYLLTHSDMLQYLILCYFLTHSDMLQYLILCYLLTHSDMLQYQILCLLVP